MIEKTITIIGGGNMGKALASALLQKKSVSATRLTVADHHAKKLKQFFDLGIYISTSNKEAIKDTEIIILAVKPKDVQIVLKEIASDISPETLIISICAGIPTSFILKFFTKDVPIVRAMPNTPAQIGMGMTGWYANRSVSAEMKHTVKILFNALGTELEVHNEDLLDSITAVSGSGPAYFYYFIEMMVKTAVALGLSQKEAEQLTIQTFIGSAELLKKSHMSPKSLREAVTSKGGTTEAAIKQFDKKKFGEVVGQAMFKAFEKARELRDTVK